MSRFGDDGDDEGAITWQMWERNARLALKGKRGRQALRDLRDALLALPEKRLISRALCTVGATQKAQETDSQWERDDLMEHVLSQGGEGVCAVGAYIWWKKVKAGADPQAAFAELPLLADDETTAWDTADAGRKAGLTFTLAWTLGDKNDERFGSMNPEERYEAFLAWIDKELAE